MNCLSGPIEISIGVTLDLPPVMSARPVSIACAFGVAGCRDQSEDVVGACRSRIEEHARIGCIGADHAAVARDGRDAERGGLQGARRRHVDRRTIAGMAAESGRQDQQGEIAGGAGLSLDACDGVDGLADAVLSEEIEIEANDARIGALKLGPKLRGARVGDHVAEPEFAAPGAFQVETELAGEGAIDAGDASVARCRHQADAVFS